MNDDTNAIRVLMPEMPTVEETVRSMPLHGARHSFATIALQSGVPMKIVSEMLGHSSIRVTADVYSHVSPGMSAEAAEVIADQMFNA